MARPLWRRSKPFHNDETRDLDPDYPPWKAREIKKPPWQARNPHERNEMFYWMIQKLDERARDIDTIDATNPKGRAALGKLIGKKALRKLLAPSNTYRKDDQDVANWAVNAAVDTVPLIRQIWQDEYGRKNRRPDDGPSAEEIAAYLFGVSESVDQVTSRSTKPSGGPRGRLHKRKITRSN
jgi:hypothetical protein